jgi:hypothetical protein
MCNSDEVIIVSRVAKDGLATMMDHFRSEPDVPLDQVS